jgi:gas vesicle protein
MVMTAISSQKFYAETYYNFGETMTEHKGNVNISGVQGNVSGIAAAGENQTMTGVALGQISGAVTNSIGQLQSTNTPEATQLATLLEQLQSAIENESHLAPEDKAEAMEQVKTLAEAGQNPEDNVLQKAAKTALKILKGTIASLPDAAKLVESCTKLLPAITTLLSLI